MEFSDKERSLLYDALLALEPEVRAVTAVDFQMSGKPTGAMWHRFDLLKDLQRRLKPHDTNR